MLKTFGCYLAGSHDYSVWCEPGAIYLRCANCGKRSPGWSFEMKTSQTPGAHFSVPTWSNMPQARGIGAERKAAL
jgi:hypothetical protein